MLLVASATAMTAVALAPAPLVGPAAAVTDQFTLFDSANLVTDHDTYAQPTTSAPSDWTTPVNYANGRMYVRLDVTSRPSTKPVDVQVCMWRNSLTEETCSPTFRLANLGVQYIDFGKPASWWKMNGTWAWTTPFSLTRFMLKDAATGKLMLSSRCGESCYVGTDLLDHVPIHMGATAIVVAPGATLDPPANWMGCPLGWSPACANPANEPPVVSAGADRTAVELVPITMSGSISDDGLPSNNSSVKWTKVSGPGTVTFGSSTQAVTTARFPSVGVYVLRLTGTDGMLSTTDDVTVTVGEDVPPSHVNSAVVIAGSKTGVAADHAIRDRLIGLGYDVRILDDNGLSLTRVQKFDLAVVSPTVSASALPTTVWTLTIPVLNLKGAASTRFKTGSSNSDYAAQTSLAIIAEGDELAAGLAAGPNVIATSTTLGGATPVPSATPIATVIGRPTKVMLFKIETGAALSTGNAPARRVGFHLGTTAPTKLTASGWSLVDASVAWLDDLDTVEFPPGWHVPLLNRAPITVDPLAIGRTGLTAAFDFEGTTSGTFDPATITVVEVDAAGDLVDASVAAQFDPVSGFNGSSERRGELLVQLEGATAGARHFQVYFGNVGDAHAPAVSPLVSLTTGIADQGHPALLVETPIADWYYHTDGGGFSSLVDQAGNDWMAWNSAAGSAGEFRGMPNAVFPAGYLHPGFTNSSTSVVASGPLRVTFETVTDNSAFRVRWSIYADHARMDVLEAATNYWFLYEGTPGGQIDPTSDKVIRADGTTTNLNVSWSGDVVGEWVGFADTVRNRSFFVSQPTDDAVFDSYRLMNNQMTVFGFGRENLISQLAGQREFVVGLIGGSTHGVIAPTVTAIKAPYDVVVGAAESLG